jgi:hypothetical protein
VNVVVGQVGTGKQQKPGRVEQMIRSNLSEFVAQVIEAKRITDADVKLLHRQVLDDGLVSRQEAETLLALDRTLDSDSTWGDALVALVVDFVVWGTRPTGSVTAEDARWLAAALDVGGATETAMRIAYEVIEEAQSTDRALLDFILRGRQETHKTLAA